jgi:hypothetical protein
MNDAELLKRGIIGTDVGIEIGSIGEGVPATSAMHDESVVSFVEAVQVAEPSSAPVRPLVMFLVGRMGSGKSSTANLICGEALFLARRSVAAVTGECATRVLAPESQAGSHPSPLARPVIVVDTPGIGDPGRSIADIFSSIVEKAAWIEKELAFCPKIVADFAIVLVLGVNTRVTDTDLQSWWALKHVFGSRWLASTVIVWTHGDLLGPGGLDDFLEGASEDVLQLLRMAAGGQIVVKNRMAEHAHVAADPAASEAYNAQRHRLLDAAQAIAGPLPKPRGKQARRLRQHAARDAERAQGTSAGLGWACTIA